MEERKTMHLRPENGLTWGNITIYSNILEQLFHNTEQKELIGALIGLLNEISAKENDMSINDWYINMIKIANEVKNELGEYESPYHPDKADKQLIKAFEWKSTEIPFFSGNVKGKQGYYRSPWHFLKNGEV